MPVEKAYEYDEKFGKAIEKIRKGEIFIQS
jgi:hypothetical protein